MDEISYKRGHQYLTVIANHDNGRVVWVAKGRDWHRTRYALLSGTERLDDAGHRLLNALRRSRYRLWRAWELKERLRDLYRTIDPAGAARHLRAWWTSASRSRMRPFVNLARRIRVHFDGIVAAVEHGLSNSRHDPPLPRRHHHSPTRRLRGADGKSQPLPLYRECSGQQGLSPSDL